MNVYFADTFYFIALFNENDACHDAAAAFANEKTRITTTEWVLTDLGDGMSAANREMFVEFIQVLRKDPSTTIVGSSTELWNQGLDLFANRPDKQWSLTDCISFVAMQQNNIADVLTGDRHFEQAGFRALLK
jgi:uncharacterized protein